MHGVINSAWTCDLQTTKAADNFLDSLPKRPEKNQPPLEFGIELHLVKNVR